MGCRDQGLVFVLPNMSWLSPLGFAQQMISQSYEPNLMAVAKGDWEEVLDVLAVRSDDNATLVLRVVNFQAHAVDAAIEFLAQPCQGRSSVSVSELYSSSADLRAVNSPSEPTKVAPRVGDSTELIDGHTQYTFKPSSFTTIKVQCDV